MSKETGGPAFPQPTDSTLSWQGMNLRDYFAAQAMQAFIARETKLSADLMLYAGASYDVADAMLKAREQ